MQRIEKPKDGEFPAYAAMYMKWVPDDGKLLSHLEENAKMVRRLILSLPEENLLFRYARDKWTIKEMLVHLIDDERIYSYRALRFARHDRTELPGFEQDDYVPYSNANARTATSILQEYAAVRQATIALFGSFDEAALLRGGIANGNQVTVRALGYHIAGHELHHLHLLKEKYLLG
ncbi:MAG: DinB family protein [Bacteroidota bacterium]|nr:DinB family protein [Bacteroidota bacterium]MDP4255838.1 DinB family protein [Bacteroidota bacterium]MDP4259278.1 DinB family protein [Bacteroidota bacterium]